MGRRAQDAACAREGADPPRRPGRAPSAARCPGCGSTRTTCSTRRGPAHARRPVRRPPPAAGAALHARPGLGAGLPELLLHGRPHRRHRSRTWRSATSPSSPSRARRWPRSSASASAWAGGSRGCPRTATTSTTTSTSASRPTRWPTARPTTISAASRPRTRKRPAQRVLQGRRRRGLPHLLDLRPRRGGDDAHLPAARPHAQGPRRGRARYTMEWVRHHDRYEPAA